MKGKILPLTLLGNPILRRRAKSVPLPLSRAHERLIDNMIATMKKAKGVGIAAPQVGASLRLFVVAPQPNSRYPKAPKIPPLAIINPRILGHSKRMSKDWEGCLSIPGISAQVPRFQSLRIEFTTREGRRLTGTLTGFVARVFQHEFDHINGLVFLDRV